MTLITGLRLFPCYNNINGIDSQPQKGESALLLASRGGHETVVRLLIEAHALINLQDDVINGILVSYLTLKRVFNNIEWMLLTLLGFTERSCCNSKTTDREKS